ncbi:abasic site processing protein HMCES isoform X1, partial [Ixodes scapularis]
SCTERATSLPPSSSGSSTVEDAAAQRTPASPVVQHNQRWTCEAAQQYQRRAKRQLDLEDENILLEGKYRNGAIQAANATLAAANAARSFYALGEEVLREKRELVRLETTRAQLQIELIKRQLGQD